jgi:putative oxidoreductase
MNAFLPVAGGLLIVAFFLVSGVMNATPAGARDHIGRMAALGTPFPAVTFWAGTVLEFIGCGLVLANWHADIGVLCLIVFTVLATLIFHRYWEKTDPMQRTISRHVVMSNTALVGGLLLLLESVRHLR